MSFGQASGMVAPARYGRTVQGIFGCAGPYPGYANLHGPPTLIGVRKRQII